MSLAPRMSMARHPTPRLVLCYNCSRSFSASSQAITLTCPLCYQHLRLSDVIVEAAQSVTRLQTCGRLVITARGRVTAKVVQASGGIEVHGRLQAESAATPGHFYLAPGAVHSGNVRASSLIVHPGSTVLAGHFEITPPVESVDDAAEDRVPAAPIQVPDEPPRAAASRPRSRLASLFAPAFS
ncbi:MAG: polymer-forming cytoskeletal protein [Phycisphaeraceae bacterium]|nr:polymer-forming cytoskeletal protein [Phycisphaeraceae bacterium]